MYRECGARLRDSMKDKGVDALVLLGNGNVVYATGASWPLLDAGLSHVERPVAVVLADDEHPHLYMPFREGSAFDTEVPADHVHGPLYLEFDEGVEHFARVLAGLVPPGASVAVDELTGAMRRAAGRLFPAGPPTDAALVVGPGQAGQDRGPDRRCPKGLPHHRAGPRRRPAVGGPRREPDGPLGAIRPAGLRARRHDEHDRSHLAGDADDPQQRCGLDHHRRSGAAVVTDGEAVGQGRRAVDRYQHHLRGILLGLGAYLGGGGEPQPRNRTRTSPSGGRFSMPCSP